MYHCSHVEVIGQPMEVRALLLPRASMIKVRPSGLVAGIFTNAATLLTQFLNLLKHIFT